ncbi:hypothetical protein DFH09DRAFT_346566 [Mycena vulgaris]|nr:hypothetical protein DFH09DRAFT_346566 [Mycena vulgaris]
MATKDVVPVNSKLALDKPTLRGTISEARYTARERREARHRWCARCAIVKPYRAHHCRVCGTCVLKFDHHCPCGLPAFYSFSSLPPSAYCPLPSSPLLALPSHSPPSSVLPISPAPPSSDAASPSSFGARLPSIRLLPRSPASSYVLHLPHSAYGVRRSADAVIVGSDVSVFQRAGTPGARTLSTQTRGGARGELDGGVSCAVRGRERVCVGETSESASESEAVAETDAGSDPAPVCRSQRTRDRAGACEREWWHVGDTAPPFVHR